MSDKAGEAKQKDEGKPITDKELEDISGGIVVQREPITTIVPSDTTLSWNDPPDTLEWNNPPDAKN